MGGPPIFAPIFAEKRLDSSISLWYDMEDAKGGPVVSWLRSHRNDALLTAVLLLLGGALALFLWFTRQAGGTVSVRIDGKAVMELPLSEDTQIVLGENGHTNTLIIRDGTAQVIEASCPDKICVGQGAIQYAGESIVCLPHKLVITVQGGPPPDIDGTAG